MEASIGPYELPGGRARRDLLHSLHLPLQAEDLTAEERADLAAGLQRLRRAILAHREHAA